MPWANWSTVRLTKWPSTIGIHFITTLHSLPVSWLQEQGAHITTGSWLCVTLCYHDEFLPWGHYHNIVLFYHDSPITPSHFMDPTDRAIKSFYRTFIFHIDAILILSFKKIPSWFKCQKIASQHCFRLCDGNKSVPKPMLTHIYVAIGRY